MTKLSFAYDKLANKLPCNVILESKSEDEKSINLVTLKWIIRITIEQKYFHALSINNLEERREVILRSLVSEVIKCVCTTANKHLYRRRAKQRLATSDSPFSALLLEQNTRRPLWSWVSTFFALLMRLKVSKTAFEWVNSWSRVRVPKNKAQPVEERLKNFLQLLACR